MKEKRKEKKEREKDGEGKRCLKFVLFIHTSPISLRK
jgi:hypothetical protein